MKSLQFILNGVEFYIHYIQKGRTKWLLADPFLLALEFTRSYNVIEKFVPHEDRHTYGTLKILCHRERIYVKPTGLLDDSFFINGNGLRRLIKIQLENPDKRENTEKFVQWMKMNRFTKSMIEEEPLILRTDLLSENFDFGQVWQWKVLLNKRHEIWSIIEDRYPHFSYSFRYTEHNIENIIDEVHFLTEEELREQYHMDVTMCEDNFKEDYNRIKWFKSLGFKNVNDALRCQLSAEEGKEQFELIAAKIYNDDHDDKENQAPI